MNLHRCLTIVVCVLLLLSSALSGCAQKVLPIVMVTGDLNDSNIADAVALAIGESETLELNECLFAETDESTAGTIKHQAGESNAVFAASKFGNSYVFGIDGLETPTLCVDEVPAVGAGLDAVISAVKASGISVLAVVYNDTNGEAAATSITEAFADDTHTVVSVPFELSTQNFKSVIEKLEENGAEAVWFAGGAELTCCFLRQFRQVSDITVYGTAALWEARNYADGGEGNWLDNTRFPCALGADAFYGEFINAYGYEPSYGCAVAYYATEMLIEAAADGSLGSTETGIVIENIKSGLTYEVVTYRLDGDTYCYE